MALDLAVARVSPGCDDVEAELAQLAVEGGPLRRELARIAGRFVAREAWAELGFVRLGDYARERVGLSTRELQELARVDARLSGLPRLESALVSGQLGWTAVRLASRVATVDDERAWIGTALEMSTRELGLRVRTVERAARDAAEVVAGFAGELEVQGAASAGGGDLLSAPSERDDEEPLDRLRILCSDAVARKWGDVRRLLRRTTGEWLPWSVCAEYVAAEVMSALPLAIELAAGDGATAAAEPVDLGAATNPPLRAVTHDAILTERPGDPGRLLPDVLARPPPARAPHSRFVAALGEELAEADAFELDRRLRRAVALERGTLCRMAPLLAEVADAKAYRELGLASLDAYARERMGMSPRKARGLLRLERACQRSPVLRQAWAKGVVSWSQAQLLVGVVTTPGAERWHGVWIERASAVSVRRLEDDVDDALARGELDPARLPLLPELGLSGESAILSADLSMTAAGSTGAAADPCTHMAGRTCAAADVGAKAAGSTCAAADPSTNAAVTPGAASGVSRSPEGVQTRARPTHWRERTRVVVVASSEVVRLFRACLATVQLALERSPGPPATPGEALEAMCDHVLAVWTEGERRLTAGERRARRVYQRDGWRCTVPGCQSYRNLQAHHIRFRSLGGGDEASNLTTLCAAHHHRAVHTGRIRIEGSAPYELRFAMPLGSWLSGDRRA